MMNKILVTFFLLLSTLHVAGQDINQAEDRLQEFESRIRREGKSAKAFEQLYSSYEEYLGVNRFISKESRDHLRVEDGFIRMFPYLREAAYFYTAENNSVKASEFACAYVEVSLIEGLENLPKESDYPVLTRMAAVYYYNSKRFFDAARCFQAYVNTGDPDHLQSSIFYMADSYKRSKDDEAAYNVASRGLKLFPGDENLLVMAVNYLAASKTDDSSLRQYVDRLLTIRPNNESLILIQGELFERTREYESASRCYNKLFMRNSSNLDVAKHLAINYYNAGIASLETSSQFTRARDVNEYKSKAQDFFSKSAKILEQVIVSDPWGITYSQALANAYSFLGDAESLERINEKLLLVGLPAVGKAPQRRYMSYDNRKGRISNPSNDWSQGMGQPKYDKNRSDLAKESSTMHTDPVSDVDTNIPISHYTNENTFAFIIANEDYRKVAKVSHALHDGEVFAQYCEKTLGIPKSNIRPYYNTTFGELQDVIDDMKGIAFAKSGKCNIMFYYAGHGVPDESTKKAFILPVDADGKNTRVCYALSDLYKECSQLHADKIVFFLDACFSGATRNGDEMLMSARAVALDVEEETLSGNLIVFSAATGSQTALAYESKAHGMFTYFLLKKLQDTKGNTTYSELSDYVSEQVALQSRLSNRKDQTPTVVVGQGLEKNWKNMKINKE